MSKRTALSLAPSEPGILSVVHHVNGPPWTLRHDVNVVQVPPASSYKCYMCLQESVAQPETEMYTVVHGGYDLHLVADGHSMVSALLSTKAELGARDSTEPFLTLALRCNWASMMAVSERKLVTVAWTACFRTVNCQRTQGRKAWASPNRGPGCTEAWKLNAPLLGLWEY